MVLCAGYGTRLGELTRDWPKPMLSLGGGPLLAYLLAHLKSQGITEVGVNLHFRPEVIRDWFEDGSRWGLRLEYFHEPTLLGTAGGVRNAGAFLGDHGTADFLVQYGDILTDQDLAPLIRKHRESRALATLLVHPRPRSNSVIRVDDAGRITGFLERPDDELRRSITSPWVNSGLCVCSPEILAHLPPAGSCDLPRDVFVPLVNTGRLFAVPLEGYRCAIDSPERLAEARAAIAEGRCRVRPLARLDSPSAPETAT